MKVKLQDVVETMDMLSDETSAYLNKRTGELTTLTDEELSAAEEEEEELEEDLGEDPEWLREAIMKAREIIGSEDWVELPTKIDIHDYAIMQEFCRSIADPQLSDRLLNTIRGSGAFRRFRGAIEAVDLQQEWYDFRAAELEKIAVEWLEENEIAYTRETGKAADVN